MKGWVNGMEKTSKGHLVVSKFLSPLRKDKAQGFSIHSEGGVMVCSIADNFAHLRDTKGEFNFIIYDMSLFRVNFSGMCRLKDFSKVDIFPLN